MYLIVLYCISFNCIVFNCIVFHLICNGNNAIHVLIWMKTSLKTFSKIWKIDFLYFTWSKWPQNE